MLTKRKKSFCIIRGEKIFFENPKGEKKDGGKPRPHVKLQEKNFLSKKCQK